MVMPTDDKFRDLGAPLPPSHLFVSTNLALRSRHQSVFCKVCLLCLRSRSAPRCCAVTELRPLLADKARTCHPGGKEKPTETIITKPNRAGAGMHRSASH